MLLYALGFTVVSVSKIAFGWTDELAYRRNRRKFIAEIDRDFSELFAEHNGRVVPHEGENLPRAFDYVSVTVEIEEIRLRFTRGRGELRVQVAPASDVQGWMDLSILWPRIATPESGRPPSPYDELGEVAERLKARWTQLVDTVSTESSEP